MHRLLIIAFLPLLALFAAAISISSDVGQVYPQLSNTSFGRGENLEYRINYGMLSIGRASMQIEEKLHRVNSRDTYKLAIEGKTRGFTSFLVDVDDQWGAYLDTASLMPQLTYRNLKEGGYRKNEIVKFDHKQKNIEVKILDQKKGQYKIPEYYHYPIDPDREIHMRDLLGGYLFMRTLDFSKYNDGDTIIISGFFEDTFYDLPLVLRGREIIRTKAGKFKALRLAPMMPDNKLFNGRDSITAWFSDDDNKVPLRVEARMFIGSVSIELSNFNGLKNQPALLY